MDSQETWREVEGFDGRYEVSNAGRVRSTEKVLGGGRTLNPVQNSHGYMKVNLYQSVSPKHFRTMAVHGLVAAAFIGPCPAGKQINHRDCDKTNNRVANLEYVTAKENVRHAIKNGLGKWAIRRSARSAT